MKLKLLEDGETIGMVETDPFELIGSGPFPRTLETANAKTTRNTDDGEEWTEPTTEEIIRRVQSIASRNGLDIRKVGE